MHVGTRLQMPLSRASNHVTRMIGLDQKIVIRDDGARYYFFWKREFEILVRRISALGIVLIITRWMLLSPAKPSYNRVNHKFSPGNRRKS
jgi:hypothetical protein